MPTNCDNEWFVGPVPVSKAFYGETQVYPCADDPGPDPDPIFGGQDADGDFIFFPHWGSSMYDKNGLRYKSGSLDVWMRAKRVVGGPMEYHRLQRDGSISEVLPQNAEIDSQMNTPASINYTNMQVPWMRDLYDYIGTLHPFNVKGPYFDGPDDVFTQDSLYSAGGSSRLQVQLYTNPFSNEPDYKAAILYWGGTNMKFLSMGIQAPTSDNTGDANSYYNKKPVAPYNSSGYTFYRAVCWFKNGGPFSDEAIARDVFEGRATPNNWTEEQTETWRKQYG